jgi:hypothetical protein
MGTENTDTYWITGIATYENGKISENRNQQNN